MGLASKARQSWSKNRKRPHFASLSQANPSPESKKFFLIKPKSLPASVEGLNTSLAAAAGVLLPKNREPTYWLWWALKGFKTG